MVTFDLDRDKLAKMVVRRNNIIISLNEENERLKNKIWYLRYQIREFKKIKKEESQKK